jgi:hypothetical protein
MEFHNYGRFSIISPKEPQIDVDRHSRTVLRPGHNFILAGDALDRGQVCQHRGHLFSSSLGLREFHLDHTGLDRHLPQHDSELRIQLVHEVHSWNSLSCNLTGVAKLIALFTENISAIKSGTVLGEQGRRGGQRRRGAHGNAGRYAGNCATTCASVSKSHSGAALKRNQHFHLIHYEREDRGGTEKR